MAWLCLTVQILAQGAASPPEQLPGQSRSLRSPGRLARVTCKMRAVARLRALDDGITVPAPLPAETRTIAKHH